MARKCIERPRPPSVGRVIELLAGRGTSTHEDRIDAIRALAREVVDDERRRLAEGLPARTAETLAAAAIERLDDLLDPLTIVPTAVINATGVILHTNLGRAPWPEAAIAAAAAAAADYGYLELDPQTGRRGPRYRAAEDHLVALTGAADALIVNNNASAVALAVGLAGRGGRVVVSRGELIEIGGGVRIPEIVRRAGARLVEVGTTNRTRAADFEGPLAEGASRVVLRVHPSNFVQTGFTEAPDPAELAALAHRHGAVVVDDLGSGALLDTARFGLAHEPMPHERLAAGSDLVAFSGDKLVGGPQAGLLVGRADLIARLRKDPLARAMRPDKAILAGVAATLGLYRAGVALETIPVWRMIVLPQDAIRERADTMVARTGAAIGDRARVRSVALESAVGGGSLPGQTLPSWGVVVPTAAPARAAARLRTETPHPILARIVEDDLVFDLRTVDPRDDEVVARRIAEVAGAR